MAFTDRVVEALELMYRLHGQQVRKGKGVPYITHLMAVAAIVGEHDGDEEQFIAALLHDAVEDAGGQETLVEIRRRFGPRVADLVWACTDADVHPKPPWRARKEAFIQAMGQAAPEVKLIVAADKLHNARATIADLRMHGPHIWSRFTGGEAGTLWYYEAVHTALAQGWTHAILDDLKDAVHNLKHAAAEVNDSTASG